jgi:hypothetical protein
MSELTKEYFEQHLDQKLQQQTTELKAYATEQTADLARIIANTVANPMEERFDRLESRIDVTERVQHLETDMQKIKEALHIR